MPECVIVRGEDGKLAGLGDKNRGRFDKWRRTVEALEVGETLAFSWKHPRSPQHHKFFMSKLGELFDRQERFADRDRLLDWLLVGAEYCDLVPGVHGVLVAMPRSISWIECDERTFTEVTQAIDDFLWTEHAQAFLWPHLAQRVRDDNVAGWHAMAEHNRQAAVQRAIAEGRREA